MSEKRIYLDGNLKKYPWYIRIRLSVNLGWRTFLGGMRRKMGYKRDGVCVIIPNSISQSKPMEGNGTNCTVDGKAHDNKETYFITGKGKENFIKKLESLDNDIRHIEGVIISVPEQINVSGEEFVSILNSLSADEDVNITKLYC